jgi:ADP-ribosylglycohydrolase
MNTLESQIDSLMSIKQIDMSTMDGKSSVDDSSQNALDILGDILKRTTDTAVQQTNTTQPNNLSNNPTTTQTNNPTTTQPTSQPSQPNTQQIADQSKLASYIKQHTTALFSKLSGLIYGGALGDCVGIPYENRVYSDIKDFHVPPITGMPVADYKGFRKGDWSDKTDQLILLMETLTEHKLSFNAQNFAKKLIQWRRYGFEELGDMQSMHGDHYTRIVVGDPDFQEKPFQVSLKIHREKNSISAYNGSLSRCAMMSISNNWRSNVIKQCSMTHPDVRCIMASYVMVSMFRKLILGEVPTVAELLPDDIGFITNTQANRNLWKEYTRYRAVYQLPPNRMLSELELGVEQNRQSIYKALGAAFYALGHILEKKENVNYKQVILDITNQGGDSSTNGCMAGQVLGAYLSYKSLPLDWLDQLINREWLDKKIIKLFDLIIKG